MSHPCRTWPSTTTNSNPHSQHNNSWNRQQHDQTAKIKSYGNEILLVIRRQSAIILQVLLPAQPQNLGNYPSKHHTASICQHVRPYYIHINNSPTLLPRAMKPSSCRGCADILGDPYSKKSRGLSLPHPTTLRKDR